MRRKFEVIKTQAYPLGVYFEPEGMHIAAVCERTRDDDDTSEFGVILYDKKHRNGVKIPFPKESKTGCVFAMLLKDYHDTSCSYLFYRGDRSWQDPYCKRLENPHRYGVIGRGMARCMVQTKTYDWEEDRTLGLPYEDMMLYALHVRGFTKHSSSGVQCRGTYAGIAEKIPYLKELGITSLLLMPSYEFEEIMENKVSPSEMTMEQAAASYRQIPENTSVKSGAEEETAIPGSKNNARRVNYWGYQKGLYYIPKSGYAYSKDPVTEYKDMVKALHRSGIEVLMQFYFPPEISPMEMLEILKYWILEYHIDGFHVLGTELPIDLFAREPLLAETKLLTIQQYCPKNTDYIMPARRLGWLSDGFLYDMRRVLKGDDNLINQLIFHMRNNRTDTGIINYIAKWDGMRLKDLVSYDRKHNEQNGENNQDGTDYNCSWNCGIEGKTRRKYIADLRMRQMKNALSLVFLSQGTPLLYSGDEFGNTQDGNNNPYCQDNAVAWIKWNQMESGRELLDYTKALIALRRAHPILHSREPLKGMDYLSCGYPDISFHGREAWRPDTSPVSRSIGIMYCGWYGEIGGEKDDTLFYIGVNFHWKGNYLGLPQPPKGKEWTLFATTDPQEYPDSPAEEAIGQSDDEAVEPMQEIYVSPRSMAIYTVKDRPIAADKRKSVRTVKEKRKSE